MNVYSICSEKLHKITQTKPEFLRFAIVDIETTGGFPQQHGITEIAIVVYNGKTIEERYETLVNPHQAIPPFVAQMTGISQAMVAQAPDFADVAPKIFSLLSGAVFVAHNVNFDYSFVKYNLQAAGFQWSAPKLCTIRLSRKVFPGFKKYGLGHLSRELGIQIKNRHRAGGDADATTQILDLVIQNNGQRLVEEMLAKENREYLLPPNLPAKALDPLPDAPGVYYFLNQKQKVVYVGKAKSIRKRVLSHFTGLDPSRKRQDFLREICAIEYKTCPTPFIAGLLESIEIKRLWPAFNKSQKRFEQQWGIYAFEDGRGFVRLAIDKKHKHAQPIQSFGLLVDAHRALWKWVREFDLDPVLCFLAKEGDIPPHHPAAYNAKVSAALAQVSQQEETVLVRDKQACILLEKGVFYGMGEAPPKTNKGLL
ncbi:MAG: DNA polymerase III subunit epsilon, partial [Sphingobacteriia bacterium]